jgi:glycerol-3-phosphate dehydrogenase (NAD(P)+)
MEEAKERLKGITLESISAVKSLYEGISILADRGFVTAYGKVDMAEFPLIEHLYGVLFHGKDAEFPWERFSFDLS